MSLSDFDGNKPGGRNVYVAYSNTTTFADGTTSVSEGTGLLGSRNRTGNISKPAREIPGTTTLWRKSSTFSRQILRVTAHPMSKRWISGSHMGRVESSMSYDLVGNSPKINEMLPMFPTGGYTAPEYIYNDRARAITECLLKLGDGKANLAESLVTYRQTVDLLVTNASILFKALLAVKRGNLSGLKQSFGVVSRGISSRYLEWKYGWEPLCSDIYAIYQELKDINTPPARLITARRTIKGDQQITEINSAADGRVGTWKTKSSYTTVCSLTGRLSDEWLRRGTQFGLNNPAALAWELVPWSFVVDWAIPIGNVIQAFTAPAGLTFVDGYTSAHTQGRKTIEWTPPKGIPVLTGTPANMEVDRFGFRRDALTNWPAPLPYVKSPLSTTHTANALALLRQLMK